MSYDFSFFTLLSRASIERSPDHWWVTTLFYALKDVELILKGHQIIGELRLFYFSMLELYMDWKVTRSLVSYDAPQNCKQILSQIERSPDHWWVTTKADITTILFERIERSPDHWWVTTPAYLQDGKQFQLKGHQIIGELRLKVFILSLHGLLLKGHQIIGELRLKLKVI